MSLHGVDDVLEGYRNPQYTAESIIRSVFTTYALIMEERRKVGNPDTGFTREEYMAYKGDDDPHRWIVEDYFGNWAEVRKFIPTRVTAKKSKVAAEDTMGTFIDILNEISDELSIPKAAISAPIFDRYQKEHGYPSWQTFAKVLVGDRKWSQLLWGAIDEEYRRSRWKKRRT